LARFFEPGSGDVAGFFTNGVIFRPTDSRINQCALW